MLPIASHPAELSELALEEHMTSSVPKSPYSSSSSIKRFKCSNNLVDLRLNVEDAEYELSEASKPAIARDGVVAEEALVLWE
ncbi:hypothetical protein HYALB_00009070 [Hymenoscyphus albidus]|uniref:Uncharacterized protein n=1 Tax=Hymenoscyphus albidus TaxID=595503 RepID=A0A9N9Q6W8_9HELO|nr:hypothetical protein HYALB_00009070 [Hymenoscyphus albidus]